MYIFIVANASRKKQSSLLDRAPASPAMLRTGVGAGAAGAAGGAGSATLGKRGAAAGGTGGKKSRLPTLDDFLGTADYTGAITYLEFQRRAEEGDAKTLLAWIAWCAFHLGDYAKAARCYDELIALRQAAAASSGAGAAAAGDSDWDLCKAACLFMEGNYADAEALATTAPDCPLKHRLLFHAAHRSGNEAGVREQLKLLNEANKADQLSLAAMHFLRRWVECGVPLL